MRDPGESSAFADDGALPVSIAAPAPAPRGESQQRKGGILYWASLSIADYTVTALPPSTTRSPSTRTRTVPPRRDAW